jgi:hypothetical protein
MKTYRNINSPKAGGEKGRQGGREKVEINTNIYDFLRVNLYFKKKLSLSSDCRLLNRYDNISIRGTVSKEQAGVLVVARDDEWRNPIEFFL